MGRGKVACPGPLHHGNDIRHRHRVLERVRRVTRRRRRAATGHWAVGTGLAATSPQQGSSRFRRTVPLDRRALPAGAGILARRRPHRLRHRGHHGDGQGRRQDPGCRQRDRYPDRPHVAQPLLLRRRRQRTGCRGASALRWAQLARDRRRRDADHDGAGHDPRRCLGVLPGPRRRRHQSRCST